MTLGYITVIGSLNIDHIFFIDRLPILGESYEAQKYKKALGGKGANAAIATYRSCHKNLQAEPDEQPELDILVRMIGAVGDDADGTGMLEILGKADVDVSGVVQVKDGTTGMTFIMVEEPKSEDGSEQETTTVDNRFIYTIGANATLQPAQFANADNLTDRDGIRPDLIISQLEIAREAVETILKTAHKAGIQVLLNAAPAKELRSEFYCYVTHLLVNEAEAAMLYGCPPKEVNHDSWAEIAKYFLESGVENFVITLGAKGAFYAKLQPKSSSSTKPRKITSRLIEAFPVDEVVDPTGAG
jgi:ribokinase